MDFNPSFSSKFRVQQQEITGRKTTNLTIELVVFTSSEENDIITNAYLMRLVRKSMTSGYTGD